jgi:transposase-like protein
MVRRMLGPHPVSANTLALEVGVSQSTLSRWLREAPTVDAMSGQPTNERRKAKSTRSWTPEEKLRVVAAASSLSDEELGAFLRQEGLHEAHLTEWRQAAQAALGTQKKRKASASPEARKVRELEKELRRKDKALAEVAALLTLKKKAQAIWGDEDESTRPRSDDS